MGDRYRKNIWHVFFYIGHHPHRRDDSIAQNWGLKDTFLRLSPTLESVVKNCLKLCVWDGE